MNRHTAVNFTNGDVVAHCESTPSQRKLDILMMDLDSADGPTYYSYPSLIHYLSSDSTALALHGEFTETLSRVSQKLLDTAAGSVYLADGNAFTYETLFIEFPELKIFNVAFGDAFRESEIKSGIWVETTRFANLRSLSRMRREIRRTGVTRERDSVDIVRILLGIDN